MDVKGVEIVNTVPQVAAINDLSGFGRCSLTVSIPILSAMGYQVCPMPTALLSAHTGYAGAQMWDFTANMDAYLAHWEQLGLDFKAVFTGYLGDEAQVELLLPFVRHQKEKGALCLVDPAMADHGELYASCTPGLVREMRRLVSLADVTTPNVTEACLLTDTAYADVMLPDGTMDCKRLHAVGEQLLTLGCDAAVVTGVHSAPDRLENWIFRQCREPQIVSVSRVAKNYAGTGDVFSSVLCGELLTGTALPQAVEKTATFVQRVTEYTAKADTPLQDGIIFEPFLAQLQG